MTDWFSALLEVSTKLMGVLFVVFACRQVYELVRLRKAWPWDED